MRRGTLSFIILDGMSKISDLVDKCLKNNMFSIALTNHGNMFDIKELADYTNKVNGKVKDSLKKQKEQSYPTVICTGDKLFRHFSQSYENMCLQQFILGICNDGAYSDRKSVV